MDTHRDPQGSTPPQWQSLADPCEFTAFPNPGDPKWAAGSSQQPEETPLIYSKGLNSLVSLFFFLFCFFNY